MVCFADFPDEVRLLLPQHPHGVEAVFGGCCPGGEGVLYFLLPNAVLIEVQIDDQICAHAVALVGLLLAGSFKPGRGLFGARNPILFRVVFDLPGGVAILVTASSFRVVGLHRLELLNLTVLL